MQYPGSCLVTCIFRTMTPWRPAPDLVLDLELAGRSPSRVIDGVSVLEAYVLQCLGYIAGAAWPLEDVAVLFGVTRNRIAQVEAKALQRLGTSQSLRQAWLAWVADDHGDYSQNRRQAA